MPRGARRPRRCPAACGSRRSTVARDGITLIFSDAPTIVGANVTPSTGSTTSARIGSRSRSAASAASASAPSKPRSVSSRARALGDVEAGLAVAHRRDQRRELQQRVVAEPRVARVARRPVRRQAELVDALLGDADAVEAAAVVRDHGAAALVEQHVAAHEVGVVLGQPDRALAAADLLVDDRRSRAGRRAPGRQPSRASETRGRRPRPRSATSCRARRGPTARRRSRRRTTGRAATRTGRRAPCRRARAARAPGRRPRRAGARRGSAARACGRRASPRTRRRCSSAASSSCAASSFPGGLTVLWRTSCASSAVASACRPSIGRS